MRARPVKGKITKNFFTQRVVEFTIPQPQKDVEGGDNGILGLRVTDVYEQAIQGHGWKVDKCSRGAV